MTDSKPSVGALCILHLCADLQNAIVNLSRSLLPFVLSVTAESLEFGGGPCNPSQSTLSLLQLCLTAVVVLVA